MSYKIYTGKPYSAIKCLVETLLLIGLDLEICVFSMKLQSFEKPYHMMQLAEISKKGVQATAMNSFFLLNTCTQSRYHGRYLRGSISDLCKYVQKLDLLVIAKSKQPLTILPPKKLCLQDWLTTFSLQHCITGICQSCDHPLSLTRRNTSGGSILYDLVAGI